MTISIEGIGNDIDEIFKSPILSILEKLAIVPTLGTLQLFLLPPSSQRLGLHIFVK
jgi:hypothetical protein